METTKKKYVDKKRWRYKGFYIEPSPSGTLFYKNKHKKKRGNVQVMRFCEECKSVYERCNGGVIHYGLKMPTYKLERKSCIQCVGKSNE
tara:strand:+ start:15457 stop:15723 length:267 start_codon:yes stop_codon:yes gene_type:complete